MRKLTPTVPFLLIVSVLGFAEDSRATSKPLTFEQRVAARSAIERVYHAHRSGDSRIFDDAVPRPVVEHKVLEELRLFEALETEWGIAPTAEDLHRELERIASRTRAPARLERIYAALGYDPVRIEECFVRPLWSERIARLRFDADDRIHGPARSEAVALRERVLSGEIRIDADHPRRSVTTYVVHPGPGEPTIDLAPDATGRSIDRLPLSRSTFDAIRAALPDDPLEVGGLLATTDSFLFSTVVKSSDDSMVVATWTVPRTTWDAWWAARDAGEGPGEVESRASAGGPLPRPGATGADRPTTLDEDLPVDRWDLVFATRDQPSARHGAVAVWTGSEMILWGGAGTDASTGSRYDPIADRWTPITTAGHPVPAPGGRAYWTGTDMLVWHGGGPAYSGRYDPARDLWRPIAGAGAPSFRDGAVTAWTGDRLIVWGGYRTGTCPVIGPCYEYLVDGAEYDPELDLWINLPESGAPAPRRGASAVWSGAEMIVWGGVGSRTTASAGGGIFGPIGTAYDRYLGDGNRYDPVLRSWSPLDDGATSEPRAWHHAVWTGAEMIVWGGRDESAALDTGLRYLPHRRRWSSISLSGAPEARTDGSAVWTGEELIVWGGRSAIDGAYLDRGARYDPDLDTWNTIATGGSPSPRGRHIVVWTGTGMIVWGGYPFTDTGARYEPGLDRWTPTFRNTIEARSRYRHSAVWTGAEMIVWGGVFPYTGTGARYDPLTDLWSPTALAGAPSPRADHTAVWTGSEMIVWGGYLGVPPYVVNSGGRYDPVADAWTATTSVGAPPARTEHAAVWTGSEMIVWGGSLPSSPGLLDGGARYDPATDSWTPTRSEGAPDRRRRATAVWTGSEMIVWGGYGDYSRLENTGGRYDPRADAWTPTEAEGAPARRGDHTAVWTGTAMIVWGGCCETDTGGLYDPVADAWSPTTTIDAPTPRYGHTAVWTGAEMIVWGGAYPYPDTGGRYDPARDLWTPTTTDGAPAGRTAHTAVAIGDGMIVWGGRSDRWLADGGWYHAHVDVDVETGSDE